MMLEGCDGVRLCPGGAEWGWGGCGGVRLCPGGGVALHLTGQGGSATGRARPDGAVGGGGCPVWAGEKEGGGGVPVPPPPRGAAGVSRAGLPGGGPLRRRRRRPVPPRPAPAAPRQVHSPRRARARRSRRAPQPVRPEPPRWTGTGTATGTGTGRCCCRCCCCSAPPRPAPRRQVSTGYRTPRGSRRHRGCAAGTGAGGWRGSRGRRRGREGSRCPRWSRSRRCRISDPSGNPSPGGAARDPTPRSPALRPGGPPQSRGYRDRQSPPWAAARSVPAVGPGLGSPPRDSVSPSPGRGTCAPRSCRG